MEKLSLSEVGWFFVQEYYTFLNREPERLHCFYTKKSTFIHGDEGDNVKPYFGQQEIHKKILELGFSDCKVLVSNVDSQASTNGGIVIQVLGEMSNCDGPSRRFAQTFFLAEQPNGYFVLNDIFRYLKEDMEDGELCNGQCHTHPLNSGNDELSSCVEIDNSTQFALEEKFSAAPVSMLLCDNNADFQSSQLCTAAEQSQDLSFSETPVADNNNQAFYEKSLISSSEKISSSTEHISDSGHNPAFGVSQSQNEILQTSASSTPKTWANLFDKTSIQMNKIAPSVAKPTTVHKEIPLIVENTSLNSTSVFVKNIKDSISEADLRHIFSKFGAIRYIEIRREKSCALICFETSAAVTSAIAANFVKTDQDTALVDEKKNNRDRNKNINDERRITGREYIKYKDEKRACNDKRGYMNKNRGQDRK
ncbi:hypothetical protein PCANB_001182 [Pneumocystis canis]|nr:hypothetical protein PCK1_001221 [Pneumocystis canis]KAG5437061.1 hypothetical protein PCANB_001182 [Pneumocystis canis]